MTAILRRFGYTFAVLALALAWGAGEVHLSAFHHHGPDDHEDHEDHECPFTACLQGHSSELPSYDTPCAGLVFAPDVPLASRAYVSKAAYRNANAVRGPPLSVEATY